jgi:hypothetical protein
MKRIASFVAPLMVLALALAYSHVVRAEDAAATGSVSVTVTDKDGKAVEGATVRVTMPRAKNGEAKTGDAKTLADDGSASTTARPTPVAEGKTDKDGKATLDKVPAGDYNVSANLKGVGSARQKVSVKAGETLSVELKLAPRNSSK